VKKRYRKKKKKNNKGKLFFFFTLIIISLASYWGYSEIGKPKFAKNWSETKADKTNQINLPKDEAHHSNAMEWWYYNGHLITESGKKYSFHFTTFLLNNVMTHTVFHGSLTDHQKGEHYTAQYRHGGNLTVGVEDQFDFKLDKWLMQGSNGRDRIKADNDTFSFDLKLESSQPPIYHGNHGVITLKDAETSYYYSRTRMNITGFIKINNKKESVTGISWFDHQWGDFSTVNLSWDWFSLQLDDETDIMLYQIRDKLGNPVRYEGSYTKKGKTEILNNTDFVITPISEWKSKKTLKTYPTTWNIKIPDKKIDINIKSIVNDSEFDAKITTYNSYWEGAIDIMGSHTGKGFIELNGARAKN